MARRTVLTGRQRSALFSLPQHEADLLRHYTPSDEAFDGNVLDDRTPLRQESRRTAIDQLRVALSRATETESGWRKPRRLSC